MPLPTLYTERLILRMPTRSDLDYIFQLGNNPEIMRYISFGQTQTYSEARSDLRRRIRQSQNGFGYWVVEERDTNRFIGWMSLKPFDETGDMEMGYRFLQEHWNKGYATEGGLRLLHYAFHEKKLDRVVAVSLADNSASTRVMEKIGLRYDHTGRYYDTECVFYAINRQTWDSLSNGD